MSDSENNKSKSDKIQQLTGNKDSKEAGRRKLLKAGGVVASTALVPEKWQKPVVDTVVLPVHAQTSGPLVGPILINGRVGATRPAASITAKSDNGVLDAFIRPASAGGMGTPTPTTPAPTETPTPSPSTPSPTMMYMTPSPTMMVPCPAQGQCAIVYPPNASNQVKFTITNVGTGMLNMMGPTSYQGLVAGIPIDGFFIGDAYSETQGTLSGGGCIGAYTAMLGGECTPASPTPSPTPL